MRRRRRRKGGQKVGKERKRKRGRGGGEEEVGGGGSPCLRVTLPPFLCRSPSPLLRARSLPPSLPRPLAHTPRVCACTACRGRRTSCCASLPPARPPSFPLVVFFVFLVCLSPPPSPPPPLALSFPLQTFLLTSSDSAWKEGRGRERGRKNKMNNKKRMGFIPLPLSTSLLPKPFHTV